MIRVSRYVSLLAVAPLLAACASDKPYDPTDYSGRACDNTPGVACVWAGVPGIQGFGSQKVLTQGDGQPINESWLDFPADLTFAPDGTPWVIDWNNHRVRVVHTDGTFQTIIGTGQEGDGPVNPKTGVFEPQDEMPYPTAPGCAPEIVQLNHPTDIQFAPDGTLVLDAWHDNKIRVLDLETGLLKVLAGGTYGFQGDGGPAWGALFNQEKSIALDPAGVIYVNDQRNERIRKIDVDANRTITTIAGTGTKGYAGDDGPALQAQFAWDNSGSPYPSGALLLKDHELYIADSLNQRLRVMDLDTGMIRCVAGDFDGCQFRVTLQYPMDLEWGPDGRMYIDERDGNVIDALDLSTGELTAVAGNGQPCSLGDDCIEKGTHPRALELQLNNPFGIEFDPKGNLYIADTLNDRIVRVAQ